MILIHGANSLGSGGQILPDIDDSSYYVEYLAYAANASGYFDEPTLHQNLYIKSTDAVLASMHFNPTAVTYPKTIFSSYVHVSGQYGYSIYISGIASDNPQWAFKNGTSQYDTRYDFNPPSTEDIYDIIVTPSRLTFGNVSINNTRPSKTYMLNKAFQMTGTPIKIYKLCAYNEDTGTVSFDLRPFFDGAANKCGLFDIISKQKCFPTSQSGISAGPAI